MQCFIFSKLRIMNEVLCWLFLCFERFHNVYEPAESNIWVSRRVKKKQNSNFNESSCRACSGGLSVAVPHGLRVITRALVRASQGDWTKCGPCVETAVDH